MEQFLVCSIPDLIHNAGLQVYEDGTRHVLPGPGLVEEGAVGVVTVAHSLVAWHGPIGLDAVLQAVELPAGVTDLDSGLTHVD